MPRNMSRRELLRMGGLMAIGAVGLPPLLAACGGGDSTNSASPVPTTANPTLAAPTVAKPTVAAPAAATSAVSGGPITVKAHEAGSNFVFDIDKLAVPAGDVTFNFSNTGTLTHELMVYPVQDLSAMLALKRNGNDVDEGDYIKAIVGSAADIGAGKSATFNGKLDPGFYEFACHAVGKNPDGTTFLHFDKGQTVTVAAIGVGGPDASVLTPSSTISVQMVPGTGEIKDSWLFVPDHLMAKSGDVTFNISNKMDMNHDVVVYPLGDISGLIKDRLAGGENYSMIQGQQLAEDLEPGKSVSKVAKLTPGWWGAACFVVSKLPDGTGYVHRDRGQRFSFLVS
jgi:plastocyanin